MPTTTMEALLKKNSDTIQPVSKGELLEGIVVKNDGRNVLIDIGGKSEGILSRREIREENLDLGQFKVGEKVPVIVNQSETDQGFTILSFKKASTKKRWKEINEALTEGKILPAKVTGINSGGLVVDLDGLEGFVPTSHLNQEIFLKMRDYLSSEPSQRGQKKKEVVGTEIKVKIIEIDRKRDRLVASQKKAVSEEEIAQKEKELAKFKAGDEIEGEVTNVTPFGIFVRIGAIEGLAHISELSWEHIAHPAQLFSSGDKVKVKVLAVDPAKGKLALSVKALAENPLVKFGEKHKKGDKVSGKVVKIVPYGVFVSLAEGVEGFIHVSEIEKPAKVGEEVEATILEVDQKKKKVSLTTKPSPTGERAKEKGK